jgi:hypothetical protein
MKSLNAAVLIIGILLLASGHFSWLTRSEDVTVRTARDMMLIVPGWALAAMGYLGLQVTGKARG